MQMILHPNQYTPSLQGPFDNIYIYIYFFCPDPPPAHGARSLLDGPFNPPPRREPVNLKRALIFDRFPDVDNGSASSPSAADAKAKGNSESSLGNELAIRPSSSKQWLRMPAAPSFEERKRRREMALTLVAKGKVEASPETKRVSVGNLVASMVHERKVEIAQRQKESRAKLRKLL